MALSTVDATIPSPAPVTGSRELSRIAAELVAKPSLWWPQVRYKRSARFYTRVCAGDSFEAWRIGFGNDFFSFRNGHRLGEEVALTALAREVSEQRHLLLGLNPFGYHIHAEVFGQIEAGADNLKIVLIQHRDKRAIDL